MRTIDADALKEQFSEGAYTVTGIREVIDNAPTVDIAQKIQSELISEVSHSIARQFLEHNEVVPFWLSIGDIRIKEAEE